MKIEIMYATSCEISIIDTHGYHWSLLPTYTNLKDALDDAQRIIDNESTSFRNTDISTLFITDCNTGEILAECKPEENNDDDEEYDDCDYETGYDPYLGCFTWDE